jgi:hypothetical protein
LAATEHEVMNITMKNKLARIRLKIAVPQILHP